jgi:short-subunit dehydrogenase
MATTTKKLAVVTGASTGIGFELAKLCVQDGYDLVIAADEPEIQTAASSLRGMGSDVRAVEADLATTEGVDELLRCIAGRKVDALLANAGRGLGKGFLDQDWEDIRHVIDTNVTGTVYLVQNIARTMKDRGEGRILIVGSIAGMMPGTFQAVYNGTKAFLDSFAYALRAELDETGVTVTCLMPGATETDFFERADMLDTKVGTQKKMPAADVAKDGYDAMMKGSADVVSGWQNKLRAAMSHLLPKTALAEQHRKMAEPGTAKH